MGIFKRKMMAAALCVLLASGTATPAAFAQELQTDGSDLHAMELTAEASGTNTSLATAQEITLNETIAGELTYTKNGASTYWDSYWYKFKTGNSDIGYNVFFGTVGNNHQEVLVYDSAGTKLWQSSTSNTKSHLFTSVTKNAWYYVQVTNTVLTTTRKDLGYNLLVSEKEYDLSKATVKLTPTEYVYDGTTKKPDVSVSIGNDVLTYNTDYKITWATGRKNVGTYAVTVEGKGDYTGSQTVYFTIKSASSSNSSSSSGSSSSKAKSGSSSTSAKAANTIVASGKTISVKAKKVKNKAKKFSKSKAFTVKNAKGALSFKKKSGNKKIKVAKNGTVTVKKGLKKGNYKVKVKVKAAGNTSYKSATKTVTLTVRIKK